MGRRSKNCPDEVDQLLLEAQRIRSKKGRPGASLPSIPIAKSIMEFAQFHGILKFRELRNFISGITKCRKLEYRFIKLATPKLIFTPVNWEFLFLKGHRGMNPPGFVPEIFEEGRGLVRKVEEIKFLLETDSEVLAAYCDFENAWMMIEPLNAKVAQWIHSQFYDEKLEEKIVAFKRKAIKRGNARLSRALVANLIDPQQAQVVQEEGDLPILSVGEREALQYLLWKIENMTEREKHIKDSWILKGNDENPQKDGYVVVFERTEALKKSYGEHMDFSGVHFNYLEKSLGDLLQKKRKLRLSRNGEFLEIAVNLVNHLQLRHGFERGGSAKEFLAVRVPYDIARLHDKLYTTYPHNHLALVRSTPPKSRLTEPEIRFFDILWQEAPFDRKQGRTIRRKKDNIIELVGGVHRGDPNWSRIACRIEGIFFPKALNMNVLQKFNVDINRGGEEIYVWRYADRETLKGIVNEKSSFCSE